MDEDNARINKWDWKEQDFRASGEGKRQRSYWCEMSLQGET